MICINKRSPPMTPPVGFSNIKYGVPWASSVRVSACKGSLKRHRARIVLPSRRSNRKPRKPSRPTRSGSEEEGLTNPLGDGVHTGAILEVREDVRFPSANTPGVSLHDFETGTYGGSEVDFVDDQKSGVGDPWSAFSRNLVALGNINHVDRSINQFWTERGSQVVPAAFDQEQVKIRKAAQQHRASFEVDRSILRDRRMRTSTRRYSNDSLCRERLATHEELCILVRVDYLPALLHGNRKLPQAEACG